MLILSGAALGTNLGGQIPLTQNTITILAVLGAMSVVSWAIILRKTLQLRAFRKQARQAHHTLERARDLKSLSENFVQIPSGGFTRVLDRSLTFFENLPAREDSGRTGKAIHSVDLKALQMIIEREIGDAKAHLAAGSVLLIAIGSTAPLLGLLGTVTGVQTTFAGIAQVGSASLSAIAPGVSEALMTTIGGLLVAIPAALAHSLFTQKLQDAEESLYAFSHELASQLVEEARG